MTSQLENQTSSKEHVLAKIRSALGRPAATVAPEPLPPFVNTQAPTAVTELVSKFGLELEKVGGRMTCVQTVQELRERLQNLFPPDESGSVAVSNGDVLLKLGIRDWLVSDNRPVVPSLEEFILARENSAETHSGAEFSELENERLADEYKQVLMGASFGITSADYALADTGTVALISGGEQHRLISLLPPVHICLLDPRRIFASLNELLDHLHVEYEAQGTLPRALTCITGPSRTADIEQTITMGVHGPRTLQVIVYAPAESEAVAFG